MNRKGIITGISLLTLAGVILYIGRRYRISVVDKRRAEQVAEHGYETAHDILFPNRGRRIRRPKYNP